MQDHDIFAALAQVRKGAVALACATRMLVPQLEEDLRRLDACCAGDGAGRASRGAAYRRRGGWLPAAAFHRDRRKKNPASVSFGAQYDLIHSTLPTAERALEQVLGFLEMRCD